MPTLSVSLADLDGTTLAQAEAWVEVNRAALVDSAGNTVRVGRPVLDLSGLPSTPATVVLPATVSGTGGWEYRVVVAYVAADKPQRWTSPWFDLTADADLADLI